MAKAKVVQNTELKALRQQLIDAGCTPAEIGSAMASKLMLARAKTPTTKKKGKTNTEFPVEQAIANYKKFVNKRKNAQHIEDIEVLEDTKADGKYPGFKALVTYKDGTTAEKVFLYRRGGFISSWKARN